MAAQHETGPADRLHSASDMESYSTLLADDQRGMQIQLADIRSRAARNARLDLEKAYIQPAGDGDLIRWPAGTDPVGFTVDFQRELHVELMAANRRLAATNQIRLRLALVAGVSEVADYGLAGDTPVLAARLVDSPQARAALRLVPDCPLVVIVDDRLYRDVVKPKYRGLRPEDYVRVVILDKHGEQRIAWITVPGCGPAAQEALSRLGETARPDGRPDPARASAEPTGKMRSPARFRLRVWQWSAITAAVIGAVATLAADYIEAPGGTPPPAPSTSDSPSAPSPGPITSTASTTPGPSGGFILEVTDNPIGTPVFSDPKGDAVSGSERIPFDTPVEVKCWAPNISSMGSVNVFYLLETAPWTGEYASANTFANGDPIGQSHSTSIDPTVPECTNS